MCAANIFADILILSSTAKITKIHEEENKIFKYLTLCPS